MRLIFPGSELTVAAKLYGSVYSVLCAFAAPNLCLDAGFVRDGLVFSVGRNLHTGQRVAVAHDRQHKVYRVIGLGEPVPAIIEKR